MIAFLFFLLVTPAHAGPALAICRGEYALCAASSTEPTGNSIVVNGVAFREGASICPVLRGPAIADLNLMNGSCNAPKGMCFCTRRLPGRTATCQSTPVASDRLLATW